MQRKGFFADVLGWLTRRITAPAVVEPTLNNLLDDCRAIEWMVRRAKTAKALDACVWQIEGLQYEYRNVPASSYNINRLCKLVLLRRCDLLASRYAASE